LDFDRYSMWIAEELMIGADSQHTYEMLDAQ